MDKYTEKVFEILKNAEKYHSSFYAAEIFHGPSLYFHRRTLEARNTERFERYLEYIYATLASWGMHRMGKRGSKMVGFEVFKESVEKIGDKIDYVQKFYYENLSEDNFRVLEDIFKGIKIMASGTTIVGNSKVMAHMIPNIIPPVDREYTLRYLKGNTNIKNGLDHEWNLFREILVGFFFPVANDHQFKLQAIDWMSNQMLYPWDTSILKVIDNLVIGVRKSVK